MNRHVAKALLGGSTEKMAHALSISIQAIYQRWAKEEYRQDQADRVIGAAIRNGFLSLDKESIKKFEKIEREKKITAMSQFLYCKKAFEREKGAKRTV